MKTHILAVASLSLIASFVTGCTVDTNAPAKDKGVHAKTVVIDQSKSALSSGVSEIHGVYGLNCSDRIGVWSVGVNGATPSGPELTVVEGNTSCELTITDIVKDGASYAASPWLALSTSYAGNASHFSTFLGLGGEGFMANAKLDSDTFQSAFEISVVFSDYVNGSDSAPVTGSESSHGSSGSGSPVLAPDYTFDASSFHFQTNILGIVTSASGGVSLGTGLRSGETYVVVNGLVGDSFDAADLAYSTFLGGPSALTATIPASAFTLVGAVPVLTARSLIIAHEEHGVRAYQVRRFTFSGGGAL